MTKAKKPPRPHKGESQEKSHATKQGLRDLDLVDTIQDLRELEHSKERTVWPSMRKPADLPGSYRSCL